MKIGPRYKIARRLGPGIFDKTQTQKFAFRTTQRKPKRGGGQGRSIFGEQLLEKQKARFFYGLNERQFKNTVNKIIASNNPDAGRLLTTTLERRLDNTIYRLGISSSRQGARQMVSHGHILVNNRRVTTPSFLISAGDELSIRAGSHKSPLFSNLVERLKERTSPEWVSFDADKKTGSVKRLPEVSPADVPFDAGAILEFYKR